MATPRKITASPGNQMKGNKIRGNNNRLSISNGDTLFSEVTGNRNIVQVGHNNSSTVYGSGSTSNVVSGDYVVNIYQAPEGLQELLQQVERLTLRLINMAEHSQRQAELIHSLTRQLEEKSLALLQSENQSTI